MSETLINIDQIRNIDDISSQTLIDYNQIRQTEDSSSQTLINSNQVNITIVNATLEGSLVNNLGIISNFSSSNYAPTSITMNVNQDFKLDVRVNIGAIQYSSITYPILAYGAVIILSLWNGCIRFGVGNNSYWSYSFGDGTQTFNQNTDYDIHLERNNGTYTCKHKQVGSDTWIEDFNNYIPNLVYTDDFSPVFGSYGAGSPEYWIGSIDLKNTSLETNNIVYKFISTKNNNNIFYAYTDEQNETLYVKDSIINKGTFTLINATNNGFTDEGGGLFSGVNGGHIELDGTPDWQSLDTWAYIIKVKFNSFKVVCLLGSADNKTPLLTFLDDGRLRFFANGPWFYDSSLQYGLNEWLYVKPYFTGTAYKVDISSSGRFEGEEVNYITVNSSVKNSATAKVWFGNVSSDTAQYLDGVIDMSECKRIENGVETTFGSFSGSKSILYDNTLNKIMPQPNYVYQNSALNATVIGALTDDNGILSGFSATNTLATNIIPDNLTSYDCILHIKTPQTLLTTADTALFGHYNSGADLGYNRTTNKLFISNGSSCIDGTTVIQADTKYFIRLKLDSNTVSLYTLLNNNNYTLDTLPDISNWTLECSGTIAYNIISNTLQICGSSYYGQYFNGSLDTVNSRLTLNGVNYNLYSLAKIVINNKDYIKDEDNDITSLYAYTDENNNTIYTSDENLQGTFKSLNTNSFTNYGAIIDNNGIADLTTPPSYIRMNNMFLPGSNSWEVFFDATIDSLIDWQTFISRSVNQTKLFNLNRNGSGDNLECNIGLYNNAWRTITCYNALGSSGSRIQVNFGFNGSDTYFVKAKSDDNPWGQEQTYTSNNIILQPTDQDPMYIDLGSEETGSFASAGCYINLATTYFKIGDNKITPAILNTTSDFYDKNLHKITPITIENYNNVVIINGVVYTRDTSKDII